MFLDSFVVLCCAGEELSNCFGADYFEMKIENGCLFLPVENLNLLNYVVSLP